MIDADRQPTPREVRIFGLLWLLFFAALGLLAWWRPAALLAAAAFVGLAALIAVLLGGVGRGRRLPGLLLPSLFAGTGALGLAGLPAAWVVGTPLAVGVGGAALVLGAPGPGRALYDLWMRAGAPVGWSVSHAVLAVVYYVVLTPIGLALRLGAYDPLGRRLDRERTSYWVARPRREGSERYFRQY